MAGRRRRRRRRLSDLPDHAIDEILCRLPIKDAAMTSVLSRRWRCRWHSIPDLDLSGLHCSQIYQILPLPSGPIRLFKVKELKRTSHLADKWHAFDVERWLITLSVHSASSLRTLGLLANSLTFDLNLIKRCFPLLTHLELSGNLKVPLGFRGFAFLRGLHIHDFALNDEGEGLSRLISANPSLETLDVSNVGSDLYFSLNINAPNLRRLTLHCEDLDDFTVTSAPLLEFARINEFYVHGGGDASATADCRLKVLGGMVTIKKLEVDYSFLKYFGRGHVPERIPICFKNLRNISLLIDFGDEKPMLGLLCLLRSCPNLLEIIMFPIYYADEPGVDHDVWDSDAQEDVLLFENLEAVTVTQTMCTRHELRFIKFVLAKAKVLKTLKISFQIGLKEKDSIVADLLEFPRVSNQARILLARRRPKARP